MLPRPERRHALRSRRQSRRRKRTVWLIGAGGVAIALVVILVANVTGAPQHGTATVGKSSTSHHGRTAGSTGTTNASRRATFSGPDGVEARWVVAENRKIGTTAWKITGAQTATGMMGYASRVQARIGQHLDIYVSTTASTFHLDAYRMGYYQGTGARLVWHSAELPGVVQPACPVTPGVNMVQCAWSQSLRLTVTKAWVQGQYLLKLVGSSGQQSYVPLTVWDPASHATYVVMAGVLTQQVFNSFGGYDLYQGGTPCAPNHYPCSTRSRVVSFDRPYANSYGNGAASYLSLVYPLTRMAEKHGLDVTYWTDITLATHANLLSGHKVLISPGHDEEWSQRMREGAVAARNQGVNLIFFGASPVLRKVRLQSSPLGADRQIVNYRNPAADPLYGKDNAEVSQNWWGQAPAGLPASTLVGSEYIGFNNITSFPLVVSDPSSWLFADTGLGAGATVPGVLATDFQAFNPARSGNPANVQILAHSPVTVEFHPNRSFADTTYYTLPSSNAGVFETGANSWIPSLSACSASDAACPAKVMRGITGNLLRVFGAGPVGLAHPSQANWQQFYG